MNNLGISILIVNYNGASYIKDALESIRNCLANYSEIPCEILIADNNSTDNSIQFIQAEQCKDPRIIFFPMNDNLGFGRANNFLAGKASFNYILLINNDTKTLNLDNLFRLIVANRVTETTVYTCEILNRDYTRQQNIFGNPSVLKLLLELFLLKKFLKRFLPAANHTNNLVHSYFSGCFLFMRKSIFDFVGGFDERFTFYHEESDFFLRLPNNISKEVLNDQIIHYGGGGGEMSEFAFVNYYLGLYKLFLFNGLIQLNLLKIVFISGISWRILLLSIGININYLPIDMYKGQKRSRTYSDIIKLHKTILTEIKKVGNE